MTSKYKNIKVNILLHFYIVNSIKMLKPGKDLATRLNQTFNLIFSNLKIYLLSNILVWIINIIILALWFALFALIVWFTISLNNKFWLVIWLPISVGILLLTLRIPTATVFLTNFKISKDLSQDIKNKVTFYISFSLNNLPKKALVDLWYFIIIAIPILIFGLLSGILYLIIKEDSIYLIVIGWIVLLIYLFYLSIKYYFAVYYCFENEKFSFNDFKESEKITKWRYLQIIGNIILIWIIIWILSRLVWLLVDWLFSILWTNKLSLSHILIGKSILSDPAYYLMYLTSFSFVIWAIMYVITKAIIKIITDTFYTVYFYIYYKYLEITAKTNSESNENK